MPKNKKTRASRGNDNTGILSMMGMDHGNDDDNDMEAELAQLLNQDRPTKKNKQTPKLMDWSMLNAQVESSLKDISDDDEDDNDDDNDEDLMSELTDLVREDDSGLVVPTENQGRRSPSPAPAIMDTVQLIEARKTMYEAAIKNSQQNPSKVRRLQRGLKTINEFLNKAKKGKPVNLDELPPEVAGAAPPKQSPSLSKSPIPHSSPQPTTAKPNKPPVNSKPSSPPIIPSRPVVKQPISPQPSSIKINPTMIKEEKVDERKVQFLEKRKLEYKKAAIQAKQDGDKAAALDHFKAMKLLDSLIVAVKENKEVSFSDIPPSPVSTSTPDQTPIASEPQMSQAIIKPTVVEPKVPVAGATIQQSSGDAVLDALQQRLEKYKSSQEGAVKEDNGSKARRMGRIVKQYQGAIKQYKAGKSVNFEELPVPPGFPPIPASTGGSKITTSAQPVVETIDESKSANEKPTSSKTIQEPQTKELQPRPAITKTSPPKSPTSKKPSTTYEQQIAFLENRQAAFKTAALKAKSKGDRVLALDYLKKMKGFDSMIEAAKNGIKVDITKVPQPPIQPMLDDTKTSSLGKDRYSRRHGKNDEETYKHLLSTLKLQVSKAREYAQQMTVGGNVKEAERCDQLATSSHSDYEYVKSCQRHGDQPPHFYYEEKSFTSSKFIADLDNDQMELHLIQCLDLKVDGKPYIEWEFPFPHNDPCKGRSTEAKGPNSLQFDEQLRVPFIRKRTSNIRAVKSKALKLSVFYKSGILRRTTAIGIASVKLSPLEEHCEIHAIEQIRDGRSANGKVELFVRLRTPLLGSDTSVVEEKWIILERRKRSPKHHEGSTQKSQPGPSTGPQSTVNISSIEVMRLDLKLAESRKNQPIVQSLKNQIKATQKFLVDGGNHAKKEYVKCLTLQHQHIIKEAALHKKQQQADKLKLSLTKKIIIEKELEKIKY